MGARDVRGTTSDGRGEPAAGPMLRILGEVRLDGVDSLMTSQQLSVLSLLVCAGPANKRTIVEALWAGQRISDQRVSNLLAEVRATVGRHHFPDPAQGKYRVIGVDTDLQRFQRGIESICDAGSGQRDIDASTAAALEASSIQVLSAIKGVPFTVASSRYWTWLDDFPRLISTTEELVADGVLAVAELLRQWGRPAAAIGALEQGLLACPLDEELTIALVQEYRNQGSLRHAQRLVAGWEARVRRLGCGEPSPAPRRWLAAV